MDKNYPKESVLESTFKGKQRPRGADLCRIQCVRFTTGIEGIHENLIVGGGDDGCLYFWSAWDLTPLSRLKGHQSAIAAIALK